MQKMKERVVDFKKRRKINGCRSEDAAAVFLIYIDVVFFDVFT